MNLVHTAELLVNSILGLQPKYNKADFDDYMLSVSNEADKSQYREYETVLILLANLLA